VYFGSFAEPVVGLAGQAAARLMLPASEQVATQILTGHEPLREHSHSSDRFDAERERAAEAKSKAAAERQRLEAQP
jgi:hypothetical protein